MNYSWTHLVCRQRSHSKRITLFSLPKSCQIPPRPAREIWVEIKNTADCARASTWQSLRIWSAIPNVCSPLTFPKNLLTGFDCAQMYACENNSTERRTTSIKRSFTSAVREDEDVIVPLDSCGLMYLIFSSVREPCLNGRLPMKAS